MPKAVLRKSLFVQICFKTERGVKISSKCQVCQQNKYLDAKKKTSKREQQNETYGAFHHVVMFTLAVEFSSLKLPSGELPCL